MKKYWNSKQILDFFSTPEIAKLLGYSLHGLEREGLRIDKKGNISFKKHPSSLGSPLTHPFITTDFSEAQLELVTPTFTKESAAFDYLKKLNGYILSKLENEEIWPASMPPKLPREARVPIAEYGESEEGKAKQLYREGLAHRYGRKMQTVSGTHYNFSFTELLIEKLAQKFTGKNSGQNLQHFKDELYFAIMRNYLRFNWLNIYLFGASPAIDKTYARKKHKFLKKHRRRTYYGEYATSLRTSILGYYSKIQSQMSISQNSLNEYVADLRKALNTTRATYKGHGLNANILQKEGEYYSAIRPKQTPHRGESPSSALSSRGVQYIELRSLDLNPYNPCGINHEQICFLHALIIYSICKPSPLMNESEYFEILENQNNVSLYGRDPNLKILKNGKKVPLKKWGREILNDMLKLATFLNMNCSKQSYSSSINKQMEKIQNPELTPSATILRELKEQKMEFIDFGLHYATLHSQFLMTEKVPPSLGKELDQVAKESLLDEEDLLVNDQLYLKGYEDMEGSTQLLMREAMRRGVKVEILDRGDNFLRLSKGKKVEYVKQGNKTSKDSYIAFLMMENKHVTKKVLAERGISVPEGEIFYNIEQAVASYQNFHQSRLIVKPNATNFGIAINFVEPNSPDEYRNALVNAFSHDNAVIVEEFVEGLEYRILVINYKVVGIVHRRPANVLGDGKSTIKELVIRKNEDPKSFKNNTGYTITMGTIEAEILKEQGFNFHSVPQKSQRVFLRKNSNLHSGGDPIDFTDQMHDSYKKISIAAAKAVKARVCGIDMLIKNFHKPANKNNYSIIELNFNPALQMHDFPYEGKNRRVENAVLDMLGLK